MYESVRQGLLDLKILPRYSYGEWVWHANIEPVHNRIALWLVHGGYIWLSSSEPSGKTHLLHALKQEHPFLGLVCVEHGGHGSSLTLVRNWLDQLMQYAFWMMDLPTDISSNCGIALFHLIERARAMQRPLLISWRCPDTGLAPPELSSRLKGMERLDMQAPHADDDLKAVLLSYTKAHQWKVNDAIIDLLLLRLPRTLEGLIEGLQAMETASLEEHRPFSQQWVRRYLARLSRQEGLFE